MSNLRAFF